jgi:hypothetical protein
VPISEEDELERLSAMIERDNLVRGLGISEFVTEMLQTARITVKVRYYLKIFLSFGKVILLPKISLYLLVDINTAAIILF